MGIGKGIAIAGIWIGVGICSFNINGEYATGIAACAMFATLFASAGG